MGSYDGAMSAAETVNGVCHHDCPDSCGWTVTVEQGVAVKIRGNPAHPYSYGELCPKVNRFLDRVYSPDRVLHPLRRVGVKGAGEFEQITWDEALAEIGTRLNTIIAEHGGEAVMPFSDAGNQSVLATQGISSRFFHHIGATRLLRNICGPTVGAGVRMTNGSGLGGDPMQLEHSKLILLWATNTKLTNRHLWPVIEEARANGAKLVVIDPIRTVTADDCDQFVQPLPGTDIAMMLAIMHVIIRDDLLDHAWVAEHTLGLDELAASVADWTPVKAAEACGVDADVIEALAHEYAGTRPAAIRTLIGAEHHENGAMFYRTLACLPALTGAWSDLGGGLFRSVGSWQDELVDEAALGQTRPAGRPRGAHLQHEPARRDPARRAAARAGDDRVELEPVGDRSQRRRRSRRVWPVTTCSRSCTSSSSPTPPSTPTSCCPPPPTSRPMTSRSPGSPLDGLERGGDRAARRGRSATASASAGSPARWA